MNTLRRTINPVVGLLYCGRAAWTGRGGSGSCRRGCDGNYVSSTSVTIRFSPHVFMAGATLKRLLRQREALLGMSIW